MPVIQVDLCVNDDHGNTADRVHALHFPGLELDTIDVRGMHFRELPSGFRIGRRTWRARHLRSCVGNIYWERYGLEPVVAAALLTFLRASKHVEPDGGFEELWRWWESNIDNEPLVARLLVDAQMSGAMAL